MRLLPGDHAGRSLVLSNLGTELHERFKHKDSLDDLDSSIAAYEEALSSRTHPNFVAILLNLANAIEDRVTKTLSMDHISHATAMYEQMVISMEMDRSRLADFADTLAMVFYKRFERTGSMDNLNNGITWVNEAVARTMEQDVIVLSHRALFLHSRFEHEGSIDDLTNAIAISQHIVEATSAGHEYRSGFLDQLGVGLVKRHERFGSIDDLYAAISLFKEAIALLPKDHPDSIVSLVNLGNAFRLSFEAENSRETLCNAVRTVEQAIALMSHEHPDRGPYLIRLADLLAIRYDKSGGDMADLDRAIELSESTLRSIPDDYPEISRIQGALGYALGQRFKRTGSTNDLERAILMDERSVASTPDNHVDRSQRLTNWGSALLYRFEETGSMEDLDASIATQDQALKLIPRNLATRSYNLNSLGEALRIRFEEVGSTDDINRAIDNLEESIASTPKEHASRARRLVTLGAAIFGRFKRTSSIADLERAISVIEEAIDLTPGDHPDRPNSLWNLGAIFGFRFRTTKSLSDLARAIEITEEVLKLTPNNHRTRPSVLSNLGVLLNSRSESTGSLEDINRGIVSYEQALGLTLDDTPLRGLILRNFAGALRQRSTLGGSMDDFDRAVVAYEQVMDVTTASPAIRIQAAYSASSILIGRDHSRALALLRPAIGLLQFISPRTLMRRDQQDKISQYSGLASLAAAVSLDCGENAYAALQLLELGKGVMANLQLELRSDISDLLSSHPDIAQKFEHLRDQLDVPVRIPTDIDFEPPTERFRVASKEFEVLLATIRQLNSFERFLLGPSQPELQTLAKDGAIAVFNVTKVRSDAILVTQHEIRSLQLPQLTIADLELHVDLFLRAVQTTSIRTFVESNREAIKVLAWLWDVAASPILNELGFTRTPTDMEPWPRVWWVASGLLNILPIHAAGYHNSQSPQTVIDRVVSSYATTIKSLAYARERNARAAHVKSPKVMLVGMPSTPGQRELRSVAGEIQKLQNLMTENVQTTVFLNPARASIMGAIGDQQIVHFSCHGSSSVIDPSESRLLLSDWETSPLTVSDLTSLSLIRPQFAFLSACHTAITREMRLLDESIHLTSAIQLAGYPSVVGTLWQVLEEPSVGVAEDVYKYMLSELKYIDCQRSAEGLHWAVHALREKTRNFLGGSKGPSNPLVWASYIHLGA